MQEPAPQIREVLHNYYGLDMPDEKIEGYLQDIVDSQQYFPRKQQRALLIKLISDWEARQDEKIIIATSEACRLESGICVITFGVLSVDWPGLFDTCTGVIHEMGWNIYFVKGISLERNTDSLGIVLLGVRVEKEEDREDLLTQREKIIEKIHQAAVGTSAKTYLLAEEFRKLEIYSQVIAYIEKIYSGDDLEAIIGMNGEAVKYFAARSRDYIENRKTSEIARQIILNYNFIEQAHASGSHIELDINTIQTLREGNFTGITVAGPAHMLYLEDCLKTIELTSPRFQLKHNREFTTAQGISVFRIEFVDSSGHALTDLDQERLKDAFSRMVLNKQRDRAQWIETIGGFEQYARAIIPLLVKEAQSTGNTQVYQSVSQATDLFIDFKVIVVVPQTECVRRRLVTDTINNLESVAGLHILAIKPPKRFGKAEVFIIDLRAHLTAIKNTETIYQTIKDKIHEALGEFRDFDEGMRTLDTAKLQTIRQRLKDVDKSIVREFYYGIEDFFRVSATGEEIVAHIRIALDMMEAMRDAHEQLQILHRQTGSLSLDGKLIPTASLFCLSYPHKLYLLNKIIDVLEPYEVTLSRMEKSGNDILICRITEKDRALTKTEEEHLEKRLMKIHKIG